MTDAPNPLSPMAMHMASVMALWSSAPMAAMGWQMGTLPVHPDAAGLFDGLKETLAPEELLPLQFEIASQSSARTRAFLEGVEAYRSHPYRRPDPTNSRATAIPLGTARLLDYGGTGQPILLVPSLINPAYILDLMPQRSLVEHLKTSGYRPLLLDWGDLSPDDHHFSVNDYIIQRLMPALDQGVELSGGPIPVLGYCMGGTLSAALAVLAGEKISALMLLAAPWDFAAEPNHPAMIQAARLAAMIKQIPADQPLEFDILQSYFAALDPTLADQKFRRFNQLDKTSEEGGIEVEFFVALEQWANSGPALAGPTARQTVLDWYENNATAAGQWQVDGVTIDPSHLTMPTFVVCPPKDRLVPPKSARALADAIPHATVHDPRGGHVGMMIGSRAKSGLYEPLTDWLDGLDLLGGLNFKGSSHAP